MEITTASALRDSFATAAMQALLSSSPNMPTDALVEQAYTTAYAMLKERDKYYDE